MNFGIRYRFKATAWLKATSCLTAAVIATGALSVPVSGSVVATAGRT